MEKRGKLITFEGPEGSGKSTQIKLYKGYLESKGIKFKHYIEPYSGTNGVLRSVLLEQINTNPNQPFHPIAEFLLFAAERAQLYQTKISPDLNEGYHVLIDRSLDSSDAYQGAGCFNSNKYILSMIRKINRFAMTERSFSSRTSEDSKTFDMVSGWEEGVFLLPDRTLVFDIDHRTLEERLHKKIFRSVQNMEKDTIESREYQFHQRVIDRYRQLAQEEPERIVLVDGRKPIKEIQKEVKSLLDPLLEIN